MGYRSEVHISIKAETLDKLRFIYPEEIPTLIQEVLDEEYPNGVGKHAPIYRIHFEDIKWYDCYGDVREVTDFMFNLPQSDYRYHCLGEEIGDYSVEGDLDDDVYPRQSLDLDYL